MVFRINRKGQIGKIITGFPVFIIILLLITSFILFSSLINKKSNGFREAIDVKDPGSLLFEQINVKYGDRMQFMTVAQAVYVINDKDKKSNLDIVHGLFASFGNLLGDKGKEGDCLFLDSGQFDDKGLLKDGFAFGEYRGIGFRKFAVGGGYGEDPRNSPKPSNLAELKSKGVFLEVLGDKSSLKENAAIGEFTFNNIDGKEVKIRSYLGACLK
jgi:hypothetical protein